MPLPTKEEAKALLEKHVTDEYQRYHALMVGTATESYAEIHNSDPLLYFITGYLHDLDFDEHPETHPTPSLGWFKEWGYPDDLIHAVEAHAIGFNGFTAEPATPLAAALMACDEICGIFYAYQKINPIPFGEMKVKSIKKRLKQKAFAAGIHRETIYMGVEKLNVSIDEHVGRLTEAFKKLDLKNKPMQT